MNSNFDNPENDKKNESEKISSETLNKAKIFIESQIDAFMRQVGFPNPEQLTDENGWRYIQQGSATGVVGVTIDNDCITLRAWAKVMDLPSDKNLILPLMRELLEINAVIPSECRFGLHQDIVVTTITKPIIDYNENLIADCITQVMSIADNFDDPLIEKYGGTTKTRK